MRFRLPYDAYQNPARVSLKMLTDRVETYDLNGDHLDEDGQPATPIFVESKNVVDAGNQASEFPRFLAQAYSATRSEIQDLRLDPKYEFMWATTSPWKGSGFRQVASPASVLDAVRNSLNGEVLPTDHTVDEELARTIAGRIWLWVIPERQDEMVLSPRMRGLLAQQLEESSA